MITIDQYAYESKLRGKSPAVKAVIALGTLFVCVGADSMLLSALIFVAMAVACIKLSGVSNRTFLRLCGIPFWFVLIGALTVAVRLSDSGAGMFALPMFGRYLVLTQEGAVQAVALFLKSMGSVACVYFLYVSTSVNELLGLLDRLHLPKLFIELMMMIYRFIFVLLGMMEQISIAQKSRLGNAGFAVSLRSAGILASSVFIKAFKRSDDILSAMESRGYDGSMDYTASLIPAGRKEKWMLALYGAVLAAAAILCIWAGV